MVLLSSTVMTPSLPTFSIASEISLPMVGSAAEFAATFSMDCLPLTGTLRFFRLSTAALVAASMPLRSTIGFAPAARFFRPSRMIACASRVAVVVPSPATSLVLVATSFTS